MSKWTIIIVLIAILSLSVIGSAEETRQNFYSFGTCSCDRVRILGQLMQQNTSEDLARHYEYAMTLVVWGDLKFYHTNDAISYCNSQRFDMNKSIADRYYEWKPAW